MLPLQRPPHALVGIAIFHARVCTKEDEAQRKQCATCQACTSALALCLPRECDPNHSFRNQSFTVYIFCLHSQSPQKPITHKQPYFSCSEYSGAERRWHIGECVDRLLARSIVTCANQQGVTVFDRMPGYSAFDSETRRDIVGLIMRKADYGMQLCGPARPVPRTVDIAAYTEALRRHEEKRAVYAQLLAAADAPPALPAAQEFLYGVDALSLGDQSPPCETCGVRTDRQCLASLVTSPHTHIPDSFPFYFTIHKNATQSDIICGAVRLFVVPSKDGVPHSALPQAAWHTNELCCTNAIVTDAFASHGQLLGIKTLRDTPGIVAALQCLFHNALTFKTMRAMFGQPLANVPLLEGRAVADYKQRVAAAAEMPANARPHEAPDVRMPNAHTHPDPTWVRRGGTGAACVSRNGGEDGGDEKE